MFEVAEENTYRSASLLTVGMIPAGQRFRSCQPAFQSLQNENC